MPERPAETFDTRTAYLQAVDAVIPIAKKEICIFDADLKNLDLDDRTRADAIAAFLAGDRDRRLRIVLHDLDHLTRYSPRLMTLLKRFGHCLTVRQPPESLRNLDDCFVLIDGVSGVIRFHADHFRGKALMDQPLEIHDWQQRFEGLWIESMPGVAATHIGL
jgi:hypothetical protein